jgi:hypothetical protein
MGTRNKFSVARPCCATTPPPCAKCTHDPGDILAVTFGGFTEGFCDSEWLNASFLLSRVLGYPCLWRTTGSRGCGGDHPGYSIYSIQWILECRADAAELSGAGWWCHLHTFINYTSSETADWKWETGLPDPFDCTIQRNLPFWKAKLSLWPFGGTFGIYENTTCQVN